MEETREVFFFKGEKMAKGIQRGKVAYLGKKRGSMEFCKEKFGFLKRRIEGDLN